MSRPGILMRIFLCRRLLVAHLSDDLHQRHKHGDDDEAYGNCHKHDNEWLYHARQCGNRSVDIVIIGISDLDKHLAHLACSSPTLIMLRTIAGKFLPA